MAKKSKDPAVSKTPVHHHASGSTDSSSSQSSNGSVSLNSNREMPFQQNEALLNVAPKCSSPVRSNAAEIIPVSLNAAAKSFQPGTIDALFNAINGSPPVRSNADEVVPVQKLPPSQVGKNAAIPNAWARRKPASFEKTESPELFTKDGVVLLDEDEAASLKSKYANALVGRVIGKNFPFEWLTKQLHLKWGAMDGFKVKDLGEGCFMLHFASREGRDQVWLGGPWHIAGFAVGLDQWSERFVPSMNPQMLVPTWIRLPGLPMHFWGQKNLGRIATMLGDPICIDANTLSHERTSFARLCIRRDLSTPVLGGLRLYSEATGEFFQRVKYEGIASLCTTCGLSGHEATACGSDPESVGAKPIAGLDDWTLVPPRRIIKKPNANLKQQQPDTLVKPVNTAIPPPNNDAFMGKNPVADPPVLQAAQMLIPTPPDEHNTASDKHKHKQPAEPAVEVLRKSRSRSRQRKKDTPRKKSKSKYLAEDEGLFQDSAGDTPLEL